MQAHTSFHSALLQRSDVTPGRPQCAIARKPPKLVVVGIEGERDVLLGLLVGGPLVLGVEEPVHLARRREELGVILGVLLAEDDAHLAAAAEELDLGRGADLRGAEAILGPLERDCVPGLAGNTSVFTDSLR